MPPYLFLISILFLFGIQESQAQTCDSLSATKVECRAYYSGKKLRHVIHYRNGLRHGTWVFLHEDGNYDKRIKYRKGARIWELHYRDGNVIRSIDRKGREKERKNCGC
jgi:antitoxin component YwqK of YwqJK toxin-antitoxin module